MVGDATIGSSTSCSPYIYSGLTSGEVAIFDVRTGGVVYQWRAHEAQVTQLIPLQLQGANMLITAGLDHLVCVWIIIHGKTPVLHQRFTGLEENARGIIVRQQRDAGASIDSKELVCAIGSRIGVGILALLRSSKKLASRFTLLTIRGGKSKSGVLTSIAPIPTYDFTIIGQEEGKVIITK